MNPRLKVNFYKPYLPIRGGGPPVIITLCWSYHSTVLSLLPMVKTGSGNDNSHNRKNYQKLLHAFVKSGRI